VIVRVAEAIKSVAVIGSSLFSGGWVSVVGIIGLNMWVAK